MHNTQKDFDVTKYVGTWYEIAKIPFKWEIGCKYASTYYSWDGKFLKIRNNCLDASRNIIDSRYAQAWVPNKADASKLRIKFNDGRPADPEGDYWVQWTDYDNYSIVGGPEGNFLWILARTPKIPSKDVPMLLQKVRSFGYDSNRLMSNASLLY